ncbi:amidohydrolase family protein [Actinoplanes sp. NPDC049118]|uniref:amidohydrolase family protein n=1 Tax=Actinoplanes sp. NPDC049118 TaxID=3155769 RepID=UPI003406E9E5
MGSAAPRRSAPGWRALLAAAAENPLTHAKLSGLYPATGRLDSWTADTIRPFVDDAVELFGAARLMYGGDWPVSVLAGGYDRVWDALSTVVAGLAPAGRDAILGGTATAFYRLPIGRSRAG